MDVEDGHFTRIYKEAWDAAPTEPVKSNSNVEDFASVVLTLPVPLAFIACFFF